jgi:phenylacetate-coenzyme A ligase PaaK-like adenylate-forming protein
MKEWFEAAPYAESDTEKRPWLLETLNNALRHHQQHCRPFANILASLSHHSMPATSLESLPFLPVQLFKRQRLVSVPDSEIVKEMSSSGTTGQLPSRIYLDRETSLRQSRALVSIVSSFLGTARIPMLIIDSRQLLSNRSKFGARAAAIIGFSSFGRDHCYVLTEDLCVDWEALEAFCERYRDQPIVMFGFTSIVWQHFYQAALREKKSVSLSNAILLHGGGWKKLSDQQVDNQLYKQRLQELFGITRVYNYYGMVEQTGSIYMECERGFLHAPKYSEILVRDPISLAPLGPGQRGIIQTLSVLPHSYPGNSLLTEDIGELCGRDDCSCGRKGSYFLVHGRLPAAELRGCSDVGGGKATWRA